MLVINVYHFTLIGNVMNTLFQAGIRNDLLTIALEPEAASLFCRHLPVEKSLGRDKTSLAKFQAGKKYLVLDAGGETF